MNSQVHFILIILFSLVFSMKGLSQGVGINSSGAAPDGSAMLDVSSSTKGFLLPRVALVSATDPISSPVEGLMVYNNGGSIGPDGFYYFDGTNWVSLAAGSSNNHYVGEVFSGGIVFFVDSTGQHGLMASLDDLDSGSGVNWSDVQNATGADNMTDGAPNTDSIVLHTTNSAALLCTNHTGGGHTDWYLPSLRELVLLFANDVIIDKVLDNDGNPNTNGLVQGYNDDSSLSLYWSSTEDGIYVAYYLQPSYNYSAIGQKNSQLAHVRAIRAF